MLTFSGVSMSSSAICSSRRFACKGRGLKSKYQNSSRGKIRVGLFIVALRLQGVDSKGCGVLEVYRDIRARVGVSRGQVMRHLPGAPPALLLLGRRALAAHAHGARVAATRHPPEPSLRQRQRHGDKG